LSTSIRDSRGQVEVTGPRRSIQLWILDRQNDTGADDNKIASTNFRLLSGCWIPKRLPLKNDEYQKSLCGRCLSTPCSLHSEDKIWQKRYTSTPFYSYYCSHRHVINNAADAHGAIINDRGVNTTSRGIETSQRSFTVEIFNDVRIVAWGSSEWVFSQWGQRTYFSDTFLFN
jgi:hypothetical protein